MMYAAGENRVMVCEVKDKERELPLINESALAGFRIMARGWMI